MKPGWLDAAKLDSQGAVGYTFHWSAWGRHGGARVVFTFRALNRDVYYLPNHIPVDAGYLGTRRKNVKSLSNYWKEGDERK